MTENIDLHGKVAVVTGVSTGIGRDAAIALSECGAVVCLLGKSADAMKTLQRRRPSRFEVYCADLRQVDEIDKAANAIEQNHGSIDILLNVAGVWHDEKRAFYGVELSDISTDEIADVLGVGITGGLVLTRRFLRGMKLKNRGKIVFVSCGFSGPHEATGWIHYYVANKAIEAMTCGLAAECRPYNIQVNCIAPWFVRTEAVQKFFPDRFEKALPVSEVTAAVQLFVSDKSNNVSGQVTELRSSSDY